MKKMQLVHSRLQRLRILSLSYLAQVCHTNIKNAQISRVVVPWARLYKAALR